MAKVTRIQPFPSTRQTDITGTTNNQIAMNIPILPPSEVRKTVDATHLPELIDAFLGEKQQTVTAHTYQNYLNAIRPFRQWWDETGVRYDHVLSAGCFADFIRWLENDYRNSYGHQATTYTKWRITREVRHLLRWAHRGGYIAVDVSELCPQYKAKEQLKFYPSVKELEALINAAAPPVRMRDAALVAFSVSTGARRFEIVEAKIEDVCFDSDWHDLCPGPQQQGHIRLRKVKGDAQGQGLGRVVVFDEYAGLLLKAYLMGYGRRKGSLFDIGLSGMSIVVRKLGERVGVEKIHPHAFRSALADWWMDKHLGSGMAADVALKLQLGHALPSENVTLRYIDLRNERKILRWLREYHTSPLEAMDWDWDMWPVHRV